jgi:hypothetical protein
MRGHLDVGMDLFRQGEQEAATPHVEHPTKELYEALEPAFEKRGAAGFEEQLATLEKLVEEGAPADQVEAAYREVLSAIEAAEATVPEAERLALPTRFAVAVNLVRTAAMEYDEALDEQGRVVNAIEYQDALGFVRIAEALLDAPSPDAGAPAADAIADAKAQLEALDGLWPSLVPSAEAAGDPSRLFGAAANIEIAGLHVK